MAKTDSEAATAPKPDVPRVYPVPKDRPVNERLISAVSKGQKPTEKK